MSTIQIDCTLDYEVLSPTLFMFNIAATMNEYQLVQNEQLTLTPYYPYEAYSLGSPANRSIRFAAPEGALQIHYQASVQLSHTLNHSNEVGEIPYLSLPANVLPYLNPSRYCESDRLGRLATKLFADAPGGYYKVKAVLEWVYENIDYIPGSTDSSSSISEVLLQRAGVCRDFAHLSIALCRALGIPARYVAAYAPGLEPDQDFHGVFEAFLNGRWYLFDSTRLAPVGSFVRISTGRDASDAPFATLIGAAELVNMAINPIDTAVNNTPTMDWAISTSVL